MTKIRSLPSQLSGGQQQRVAIARALGARAEADRVRRADQRPRPGHRRHGSWRFCGKPPCPSDRALIIVTHDTASFNFADRIARMDDGRITLVESQVASS